MANEKKGIDYGSKIKNADAKGTDVNLQEQMYLTSVRNFSVLSFL